ncbi:MAG: alpha/beta hydrolase [Chloroflexota bacterium]|nr:alpha/beta hydrolase [Chloroflexota bacterium]
MVNSDLEPGGRHISIGDIRLYIVERGEGHPLLLFHGGPGLDHLEFGDYLNGLADEFRLILVDERGQGRSDRAAEDTWTLKQMAADVSSLAQSLELDRYAVLGHSYGAFIALQHAVDFPGAAAQTILSSGIPSARYLEHVSRNLETFEPEELREQVTRSWERESSARTQEDVASLLHDQLPFQFANPFDPRIAEYELRTAGAVYSPDVLQAFAAEEYGGIEVEDRLSSVTQPVLVLAGWHDRVCSVEAAEAIAQGVQHGELVVFESSGHMTFVEENELYVRTVREFLLRHARL